MTVTFEGSWGLSNGEWKSHVRSEPVVYRIRATNHSDGRFRCIPRAADDDEEGVLDVGSSMNGYSRLLAAQRCLKSGFGHAAAVKYRLYEFFSAFPPEILMVEVVHLGSKELAEAVELDILERYLQRCQGLASTEQHGRQLGQGPRVASVFGPHTADKGRMA